jgi:hypothetical protein
LVLEPEVSPSFCCFLRRGETVLASNHPLLPEDQPFPVTNRLLAIFPRFLEKCRANHRDAEYQSKDSSDFMTRLCVDLLVLTTTNTQQILRFLLVLANAHHDILRPNLCIDILGRFIQQQAADGLVWQIE